MEIYEKQKMLYLSDHNMIAVTLKKKGKRSRVTNVKGWEEYEDLEADTGSPS